MGQAILRIHEPTGTRTVTVPSVPTTVQAAPVMPELEGRDTLHLYRGGGMGDVLFLAAAAYGLQQAYPGLRIAVHTNPYYRPIVEACVGVDYSEEAQEGVGLELLVERSGQALSADRVRIFAEALGAPYALAQLVVSLRREALEWGRVMLDAIDRPIGIVVPRTWCANRSLNDAALEACCDAARAAGWHPIILCKELGMAPESATDWAGRFALEAAAALLANADGLVSVDTGMLYLGAGLGLECKGLYTNWPGHLRAIPEANIQVFEPDIDCFPCYESGGCRDRAGAKCSELFDWDEVWQSWSTSG